MPENDGDEAGLGADLLYQDQQADSQADVGHHKRQQQHSQGQRCGPPAQHQQPERRHDPQRRGEHGSHQGDRDATEQGTGQCSVAEGVVKPPGRETR